MILIFEGADGVGKTTLISEYLRQSKYHWNIVNFRYPVLSKSISEMKIEQISSYNTAFQIFKKIHNTINIICDRFWIGEFIYCVLRGYEYDFKLYGNEKKLLERFIDFTNELNATIVYVMAHEDTLINRLENRMDQEYIKTIDDIRLITQRYNAFFNYIRRAYFISDFIEIDTSNRNVEESVHKLIREIERKE